MSNRALTIATLGLLSGVAVTVATEGLIEPKGGGPITPYVVQPYNNAGGDPSQGVVYSAREREIHADDEEVFTAIKMIIESGALDG